MKGEALSISLPPSSSSGASEDIEKSVKTENTKMDSQQKITCDGAHWNQLVPRGSAHVFFLQEPAASSWNGLWASVGSISCSDLQGRGSAHHGVGADGEDVKGHWKDCLHWSLRTSDLCWTTGTQTCKHLINFHPECRRKEPFEELRNLNCVSTGGTRHSV